VREDQEGDLLEHVRVKTFVEAQEYARRHEVERIFLAGLFARVRDQWPLDRAIAASAIHAGNCAPGME